MAASTTGEPDTAPSGVNPCDGALFVNLPAENEPQVGYAVNEMLCFISNKMDVMTQDLLVKLCTDFYGKGVIDNAKKLVYAKCNALNLDIVLPRFVKRQGPKKKHSDVLDIIGLCHEVGSKLPIFVARDLSNMPPVSANSFDVASLMRDIEDMKLQLLGLADMSRLSREINDAVNSITNVRPVERAPAEVDQSPIDDGSHPSEKTCRVIDVGSRPSVKTCRVIDVARVHPIRPAVPSTRVRPIRPTVLSTSARVHPIRPAVPSTRVRPIRPTVLSTSTRVRPLRPAVPLTSTRVSLIRPAVLSTSTRVHPIIPAVPSTSTRLHPIKPAVLLT